MKLGTRLAQVLRVVLGATLFSAAAPFWRPAVATAVFCDIRNSGWQDELVDQAGNVGQASSIALDPAGQPHVAYYDFTNQSLKYATWDGVAWAFDTVAAQVGDLDGFGSQYPLRSGIGILSGTVSIVNETWDASAGKRSAHSAQGRPGAWNISPVDTSGYAYAPMLKLDQIGGAHVSYARGDLNYPQNFGSQSVVYASRGVTSTDWVTRTLVSPNTYGGLVTSLALDAANHPQIA
jgi:hypothetical protein